jgi:hypothetical protein
MSPWRILVVLALITLAAPAAAQDGPPRDRARLEADLRTLERFYTQSREDYPRAEKAALPNLIDLIKRVSQLPKGDELRRQAIDLARRHAQVKYLLVEGEANPPRYHRGQHRIFFAWMLLVATETLHPGMTVEEAVAILGPPTEGDDRFVWWSLDLPKYVNPVLSTRVENGRVVKWGHSAR